MNLRFFSHIINIISIKFFTMLVIHTCIRISSPLTLVWDMFSFLDPLVSFSLIAATRMVDGVSATEVIS